MRYIAEVPSSADGWSTRHSVLTTARRAAALINGLADDRADPAAVTALLREYGERDPIRLTAHDVEQMRRSADLLREVFAADHADAVAAALNRLLQKRTGPLRLTSHGGTTPWHPHLDHDDNAAWSEWFLASSCMALTVLLWDHQRPPGRICASSSCHDVFIAHGAGPERHYCSRRCATRERVATHRRSRATQQGRSASRRR
ncbi:CGNR zinc finger domain-containing protein [Streptomyces argenteolus]|uniref:CGNR zinc finger domain-containing protein n=1 Tax=Streptomyces sp. NPDC025273 TaxID=3155251 RepID=UPI0033D9F98D